ncbi:MAG: L-2-amino-thiazoline-4-carboxylic acid hydrolase [Acetobacterium sp.]|nr:L-2-amino-thiazoline-4-carboxylic acid hydrolase [Acetobacterium sp.]
MTKKLRNVTKVEKLPNYGKDLLSISFPFKSKIKATKGALVFIKDLIKELGLKSFIKMFMRVRKEFEEAKQLDWSRMKAKGISQKNLNIIIHKMVLAKVMADEMGLEKASEIRRRFSDKTTYFVMEGMFSPPEVFKRCGDGDFFKPFKQYYIAMMDASVNAGLFEYKVIEDNENSFQINVTYCAFAEASKILGSPETCYYSTCYGDEVYFPKLCEKVGFEYNRTATIATGKPLCDDRFTRKK